MDSRSDRKARHREPMTGTRHFLAPGKRERPRRPLVVRTNCQRLPMIGPLFIFCLWNWRWGL